MSVTTSKKTTLRRSALSVLFYAIAVLLVSGSNFATIPALLYIVGKSDFELWAKLEPIVLIAIPLSGLGLQIGLINEYQKNKNAVDSLLPFHLLTSFLIATMAFLSSVMLGFAIGLSLLVAAISFLEGVIALLVAYFRTSNQPLQFLLVEGMRSFSVVALLSVLGLWGGVITTTFDYCALRAIIGGIFLLFGLAKVRPSWNPRGDIAIRALKYGWPIVLSSVAVSIIISFDRYALPSGSDIASYVAHMKVSQILSTALAPFFLWYAPEAIKRLNAETLDKKFFSDTFLAFVTLNCAASLGLWLISDVAWSLIFPSIQFDSSLLLVALVGSAVFACGNPLSVSCLRQGETFNALAVTGVSAGIGFAAIWLARDIAETLGVASGKLIGITLYSSFFARLTITRLKIEYPWISIAGIVALTVAIGYLDSKMTVFSDNILILFMVSSLSSSVVTVLGFIILHFKSKLRRRAAK